MSLTERLRRIAIGCALAACGVACTATGCSDSMPSVAGRTEAPLLTMDGCGANLHLGQGSISCSYRGEASWATGTMTGSCVGDSRVSCSYDFPCQLILDGGSTSTCVSPAPGDGNILDTCPKQDYEGPAPAVGTYAINLPTGDKTCDPPSTALQLSNFCLTNMPAALWPQIQNNCGSNTSRQSYSLTCCLPGGSADAGSKDTGSADTGQRG